ncbi:MAG: F0F1 ATP synthase subunit A [Thermohalobaculum sp.]|nr:F0F1 ATP synthase subunit A [Thermohalobaculum sp.]
MEISPDAVAVLTLGGVTLNATLVWTWVVMAVLMVAALGARRPLREGLAPSRWQTLLEVIVGSLRRQIAEVSQDQPDRFVAFIGTLFLFIAVSNALTVLPGYLPPTASLSTTAALAICVLVAVPLFGIAERGLSGYLRNYVRPSVFMLPFNVIGEASRTIALAIRLYGNMMSGTVIAGILISITPFLFPVVMQVLGLLTGMIQAYIFAILAMVYIASATRQPAGPGDGRTTHSAEKETT